jgi:magnesium transporter
LFLKKRRERLSHHTRQQFHPGASPGTLQPQPDAEKTIINVMAYGPTSIEEHYQQTVEQVKAVLGKHPVLWVNVEGLADVALIEELGNLFKIDRLALEDVVATRHRPKTEEHDLYDFVVARKVNYDTCFHTDQVSLFVGANWVLSFHEHASTFLEPVRERIEKSRGKIRKLGTDYLAYAIVDCLVDHYFPVLSAFHDQIAELDAEVFHNPSHNFLSVLRELRNDLLKFQGIAMPMLDVLNKWLAHPGGRVAKTTKPFIKDCLDHMLQVIDQIESLRLNSSDLMNQYHSNMTHKLNETMKVLTIIATIFIPLTFITSIYGMNFDPSTSPLNMPELKWAYGYPAVLAMMALIGGGMLFYFHKKGWLRGEREREERGPVARMERK